MNVSIIEENTTYPANAGCVFFCNVAAFISHRNHQRKYFIVQRRIYLKVFSQRRPAATHPSSKKQVNNCFNCKIYLIFL